MKTLGGYFGLELSIGNEYHQDALRLNTGRNAFAYILQAKKYRKVYLPYYTCDVMLEPVHKLALEYEFYHIDKTFKPIIDFSRLGRDDVFVYTNYFGICDAQVEEITTCHKNLLIDNSHAFFASPLSGADTFYSPRKFFGVPDGAYMYTDNLISEKLEKDISYTHFQHLIKRIDVSAEFGYKDYRASEDKFSDAPIKWMSTFTQRLLASVDYERVSQKRRQNFAFLYSQLQSTNYLEIAFNSGAVPMVYPYLVLDGKNAKKRLMAEKIYLPTYWKNVFEWCKKDSFEYNLAENTLFLPIDQRYGIDEMDYMCKKIKVATSGS